MCTLIELKRIYYKKTIFTFAENSAACEHLLTKLYFNHWSSLSFFVVSPRFFILAKILPSTDESFVTRVTRSVTLFDASSKMIFL